MATPADADIVLKLYDLRREAVMRDARKFIAFDFNPQTQEEFAEIHKPNSPHNAYWRQVISFWEMAATLAVEGAVDADLFAKTNGEGLFIRAKFFELSEKATGKPFMPTTLKLIETVPAAKERFEGAVVMMRARREAAAKQA